MNHHAPIMDRARGRWPGILEAIGLPSGTLSGKHGPCPMCGGKDRFRFDDRDGRGTWFCNQCRAGDGVDLVMRFLGVDFREAVRRIEEHIGVAPVAPAVARRPPEDERAKKNRLWTEARPIVAGDPVDLYLRGRAIALDAYPKCLRHASSVRYQDAVKSTFGPASYHPAMIAMVTDEDGKPATLHRTYLTADGRKASVPSPRKLMSGKGLRGAAVRLAEPTTDLGVAEGIETALSASIIFGVPCWALISTALMASWVPPAGVERVWVFADNDPNFAGLTAAGLMAERLYRAGLRVNFTMPAKAGEDFNDELRRSLQNGEAV